MGKDKDELEREREIQQKTDIQVVQSTENGRRFLWRLISHCGIYQDLDCEMPNLMAKQAGKRAAGLFILSIISDADEEKVFQMMKEAKNQQIREDDFYERKNDNDNNSGDPETSDSYAGDSYPFGTPSGIDTFL